MDVGSGNKKQSPGSRNESAQTHQRRHAKRQTEKRGCQRRTPGEEYPTVRRGDTVEMARARQKNVNQSDCTKMDGVETKYHPTQRQTEETMDGHWTMSRRLLKTEDLH